MIHGDRYDYSQVEYKSKRKKVTIICPIHGEFSQLPSNHWTGRGCLKCSIDLKRTSVDEFIKRAGAVHGERYDYSQVLFYRLLDKVKIRCEEHGTFEQKAMDHLNGSGCPTCAGVKKHSYDDFIERAISLHGKKYNYDKVEYENSRTPVVITCLTHGDFVQLPKDHLRGGGCRSCAGNKPSTYDEYVKRADAIHNGKYDYSKLVVRGMASFGTIICPKHGEFEQRLRDHIHNKSGCPKCSRESCGMYKEGYFKEFPDKKTQDASIYLVETFLGDTEFCKVGITTQGVRERFNGHRLDITVKAEYRMQLYDAWKMEQHILDKFNFARFRYGKLRDEGYIGWTECFSLKLADSIGREMEKYVGT